MTLIEILEKLDCHPDLSQGDMPVRSPIDGIELGRLQSHSSEQAEQIITNAATAFQDWRLVPAPKRGDLIRIYGNLLREHKETLGALVTFECGKIYQEGLGEVQEMIDICDFAVGLSRQLYGLTIPSERPNHTMRETWQPIGPVGIISAFNFPVAVWCWNTAIAVVCGDSVIWKPSEKTPLCALACQRLFEKALNLFGEAPEHLSQVLLGDAAIGEQLVKDNRIPVISATGSTAMGRKVGPIVAERFGRSILELGGNNALIVCPSANLEMASDAIIFGAVGTAGQRCTTTRRLLVHEDIYEALVPKLISTYKKVPVGNPLDEQYLVGPLIDEQAYQAMENALTKAKSFDAIIHGGNRKIVDEHDSAFYVEPAIVEMGKQRQTIQDETFAPILYIYKFNSIDMAIQLQNDVPQGLSSAIFTNDIKESEKFISAVGSDCGIANINIGTSGAEIGGAFGGEKATGGGRESGSDAWKGYMRRQTTTTNYASHLPLAQGIKFNLDGNE